MPIITTSPFRVAPESDFWMRALGGTNTDDGRGVVVDSSGNVYIHGRTDNGGSIAPDMLIVKYDIDGTLQWQRWEGGGGNELGWGVDADTSGNIYTTGYSASTGPGLRDAIITKRNGSDGTAIWGRAFGSASVDDYGYGVRVDSSGNVYMVGRTIGGAGAGGQDVVIVKYNSSGAIQWQRALGGTSDEQINGPNPLVLDSSSNLYFVGRATLAVPLTTAFLIAKYDTDGNIQWQKALTTNASSTDEGLGVDVDGSGNVYINGTTSSVGAGNRDMVVAKLDNSGNLLWQKTLGGVNDEDGRGVGLDGSGNLYALGNTQSAGAGNRDMLLAKYDTDGNLLWQRALGGSGDDLALGISVSSSGIPHIVGRTDAAGAGSDDLLIAKLPKDGSGTGTYSGITYQSVSLTEGPGSPELFIQNAGLTDQSISLTDQSGTLSGGDPSLTETVIV